MKTLFRALVVTAAVAGLVLSPAVNAHEKGDWLFRVGGGLVDPDSDNDDVVSVDSGASLVFNGTYFFTPNIAVELLSAAPFSHDVDLEGGGGQVAEVKHLPPTLSVQYHFDTAGKFNPYVGAGLNYTIFFDEDTEGALTGQDLDLDNSFGLAAQVGADFEISDTMFVNLDIRWIDIEADAEVSPLGLAFDVDIDPFVYSLTLGWKF
jgi:outer membrane protein